MAERLTHGDPDTGSVVRLPQRGYSRVTGKPTSFPYEITLHRWARSRFTRDEPGTVDVARIAPEDLGSAREERLRKALEDKCPKLERCRQEGARTVLALESGDLPLSNSVLIGEALARALHGREDAPDEVYLVETVSDLWFVYLLAIHGECEPVGVAGVMECAEGELLDLSRVLLAGRRPASDA